MNVKRCDKCIAIIGSGLSAIYSYYGALEVGYSPEEIKIFTPRREEPAGAVFMYESPIPWPSVEVCNVLLGTCDGYSLNQWGKIYPTSAHRRFMNGAFLTRYEQLFDAEDLVRTLWSKVDSITYLDDKLSPKDIQKIKNEFDAVICTFPDPNELQRRMEEGTIKPFWIYCSTSRTGGYTVVYNGDRDIPWVRQTLMPGRMFTEYPHGCSREDVIDLEERRFNPGGQLVLAKDFSPICEISSIEERTNDNLLRVGRLAAFQGSYLSHHARNEVKEFLQNL